MSMEPKDESKKQNEINDYSNNGSGIPSKLTIREEKLLYNYNKLKIKYDQKVKENKFLKQTLDNTICAVKTFEESFKSVQGIYTQCKELMISNIKMPSTNQIDFSTSDLSNNNHKVTTNKLGDNTVLSNNPNAYPNSNLALLKKLEDFESHYNEMSRSFNNLVSKYKILKEEKNKMDDSSLKLLNRYSQLEKQYEETMKELYSKYEEIKRFKEVDRCLVDYTLNSFMLKVDPKNYSNNLKSTNGSDPPGIKCEPLPTFAKFLANKK